MNVNEKVMVNGRLPSSHSLHAGAEIQRGMKIIVKDGTEAGVVGAVMIHPQSEEITHILLCRLPITAVCGETAVYRLIPINLITQINAETISLNIQQDELNTLMAHQPT